MGKMAPRKVKKLAEQQYAIGFVAGLKAAAEQKTIADVRKLSALGQEKLAKAQVSVTVEGDEKVVTLGS